MASAWKTFTRLFGFGKPEKTKPVRYHPYDEVSVEQLEENRQNAPRRHPYDEVSVEQLEENRKNAPRRHPYDEITDDQLTKNRQARDLAEKNVNEKAASKSSKSKEKSTKSTSSNNQELNYVKLDFQPGAKEVTPAGKKMEAASTIYSEIVPGRRDMK